MYNIQLDGDEGIILQTTDVERYGVSEDEVVEMFLTNKNIICAVERGSGIFSKSQIEVEKISLETIKIFDGNIQVANVNNADYGIGVQIIYKDGTRQHYVFDSPKKQTPIWVEAISNATREIYKKRAANLNAQAVEIQNMQNTIATSSQMPNVHMQPVQTTYGEVNKEEQKRFCNKCGKELRIDAKFCDGCGHMVGTVVSDTVCESNPQNVENDATKRRIVYEGEIRKCPGCGEVLTSFTVRCPHCGLELRRVDSPRSIYEFALNLAQLKDKNQKVMLIRSFPIPNTKEDILEFMVLASSNIEESSESELSYAWKAKIEQAYQKAVMLFKDDKDFFNIKAIYTGVTERIENNKLAKEKRKTVSGIMSVMPNLIVIVGWLMSIFIIMPLCGAEISNDGTNSFRIILIFLMIIGIFIIPPFTKHEMSLPRVVVTIGIVLSLIVLIPLNIEDISDDGTNVYRLILITNIICSCIIFVRMMKRKPNTSITNVKATLVTILVCVIIFILAYLVSEVFAFIKENEMKEAKKESYNITYEWPEGGLSYYLPVPETIYGKIDTDNEKRFKIELYQVTLNMYKEYIESCKQKGFTIVTSENDDVFYAYSDEEFKLDMFFDKEECTLEIFLDAPMEMKEIYWPNSELTKQIPKPSNLIGNIRWDNSEYFGVYIDEVNEKQYQEYVNKCIDKGFTVDYSRSDERYSAYNKKGYYIVIEKHLFDKMYISIRVPAK